MPKVEKRVARKDYPQNGIKKGDTYYFTALKLQRGGQIKRSLTPFKPSQLTNSPFKSGWLAAQEEWDASDKSADDMDSAASAIREIGEEARGSFENMPEGLQQGETGQMLEARADACDEAADGLESLKDELEALDDIEEFDLPEVSEPDPAEDDSEAYQQAQDAFDEYTEAKEAHESEVENRESEIERIASEADDLIGNMPE